MDPETTVNDANAENSSASDSMISSPDFVATAQEGSPAGDKPAEDAVAAAAATAATAATAAGEPPVEEGKAKRVFDIRKV